MVTLAAPRIYLDTNIVIRLLEYRDEEVRVFLEALHQRGGVVVTSELTLAEALVMPIEDNDQPMIDLYESFVSTGDGVVLAPVDRAVLRRTAALRARFRSMRIPDAIHVASALEWGCESLLTADRRMKAPEELNLIDVSDLPAWKRDE